MLSLPVALLILHLAAICSLDPSPAVLGKAQRTWHLHSWSNTAADFTMMHLHMRAAAPVARLNALPSEPCTRMGKTRFGCCS